MDIDKVIRDWRISFGDVPPFGHCMRKILEDRWLRIHSLPDSKRQPEDDRDREVLLHRHNTVAAKMLGEAARCVLFFPYLHERAIAIPEFSYEDKWDEYHISAKEVIWQSGAHDDLILETAEWKIPQIVLANLAGGSAYAPYDGGADLFFACGEDFALAREQWKEWLSPHPSGL